MLERNKVIIIGGPSGSGKDSILDGVLKKCTKCIRLVNATTRQPRKGEENGVDYHFLSKEKFLEGIKNGIIPEYWHAKETDRYYGTYIPDLEKKMSENKIVIAHKQIEGVRFFKEKYGAITIFIAPDSLEELRRRVLSRQDISDKELVERLSIAKGEIENDSKEYDYIIMNKRGKLDEAVESVLDILRKEKYL